MATTPSQKDSTPAAIITAMRKQARRPPRMTVIGAPSPGAAGVKEVAADAAAGQAFEIKVTEKDLSKSYMASALDFIAGKSTKDNEALERLAFSADPYSNRSQGGIWYHKTKGLPFEILKQLAIKDDLLASIFLARSSHISAFGRPQPDRFSLGYKFEPLKEVEENASPDEIEELQKECRRLTDLWSTCGNENNVSPENRMSLSQYFKISTREGLKIGWSTTEIVEDVNEAGDRVPSYWRPVDAGTIYRAVPSESQDETVRKAAKLMLEQLQGGSIDSRRLESGDLAWVQVIHGVAQQAFDSKQLVVHNHYPVADIEFGGYPMPPMDSIVSAVTTHLNIGTHNKQFFASGRAARGFLVVKSEDMDEDIREGMRQEFNASINGVGNSWRVPLFGMGAEDDVNWVPFESSGRDMEFQYLSDSNARSILSAYQISPEELPGYSHLSRGSNNQTLAESNQEYLLTAHRDVGLRPLITDWEEMMNGRMVPLFSPKYHKKIRFRMVGLDAMTAEKEAIRTTQDMNVHMTPNDILATVEKEPLARELGGDILLNPAVQGIWDKYVPVGVIMEKLMGIKGAASDPQFAYVRDSFWFQFQEMKQQERLAQQQPPQGGGGGGQQPEQGGQQQGEDPQGQLNEEESPQAQEQYQEQPGLGDVAGEAAQALGKSESYSPPRYERLLAHYNVLLAMETRDLESELEALQADVAKALSPQKRR